MIPSSNISNKNKKKTGFRIHINKLKGIDLCGDIFFRILSLKKSKTTEICRFAINTSFVPEDNTYYLDKFQVDPDSIAKNKNYTGKF